MFHVPEKHRMNLPKNHPMYSDSSYGNNGAFQFSVGSNWVANCIVSDENGWEHVSVSIANKYVNIIPGWELMCQVKNMFWDKEDTVIQYHPPESKYVNIAANVLHLWRKSGENAELPPQWMV